MYASITPDYGNAIETWGDDDETTRASIAHNEDGDRTTMTWLNSARITVDPREDSVTLAVSVGDPRGAFVFEIRRLTDGRLVIHAPHPEESLAHLPTRQSHPGTLIVTDEDGFPRIFVDPDTCGDCGAAVWDGETECSECGAAIDATQALEDNR